MRLLSSPTVLTSPALIPNNSHTHHTTLTTPYHTTTLHFIRCEYRWVSLDILDDVPSIIQPIILLGCDAHNTIQFNTTHTPPACVFTLTHYIFRFSSNVCLNFEVLFHFIKFFFDFVDCPPTSVAAIWIRYCAAMNSSLPQHGFFRSNAI